MAALVAWVDHEEAGLSGSDTPRTSRCPACLLDRANGGFDDDSEIRRLRARVKQLEQHINHEPGEPVPPWVR